MTINLSGQLFSTSAREVLLLFLIPIGGGIPAGVVLAAKRGLSWPVMTILYLISDVILACTFEPLMLWFLKASERSNQFRQIREAMRKASQKTIGQFAVKPRPFSLVMITFGTDPMTGRVATKAAGHGFFIGWTLTIIGDMLFYSVLMTSTLWLNNILGDGTAAALIVMLLMLGLHAISVSKNTENPG